MTTTTTAHDDLQHIRRGLAVSGRGSSAWRDRIWRAVDELEQRREAAAPSVDQLMRYWLEQHQRIDQCVDGTVVRERMGTMADTILRCAMLVDGALELGTATFVRRWLDAHGLDEFDDVGIELGHRATVVLHELDERAS